MKNNATILDACCGGKMFYFDKDDLREDVRILEDIDKLVSNLYNKDVHPQLTEDIHYGWHKIEIAPHKEKGNEK